MFVNNEILEKYGACASGKEFINRLYPNGVEILDLLNNKHVPVEILHWGAKFLPVSEEELRKYEQYICIQNSTNCLECEKVFNSKNIYKSKNIDNSEFIKYSRDVYSSQMITNSVNIFNSSYINNSEKVEYSTKVVNSKSISNCKNIINSSDIGNCNNLSKCYSLKYCNTVLKSDFCELIGFSSFLTGCSKMLFCTSLVSQNLMIFNKPISLYNFNDIYEDFLYIIQNENIDLILDDYNDNSYFIGQANPKIEAIFNISDNFINWIKTLPNYDNFIMYQITLNPIWLD